MLFRTIAPEYSSSGFWIVENVALWKLPGNICLGSLSLFTTPDTVVVNFRSKPSPLCGVPDEISIPYWPLAFWVTRTTSNSPWASTPLNVAANTGEMNVDPL